MGIRLIVEVLDTPLTLTHRERCLLVALAEDANDETSLTWSSIEDPKILRRAGLKSRTQLYAVVKELTAKGALTKATAGQRNATAKYRLTPQSSVQRDTERPVQGPAQRDTEQPQSPAGRDAKGKFSVPENGTLNGSQCPVPRDFSVPLDGTPTPLPLKRNNSPAPAAPEAPAAPAADFEDFWAAYPRRIAKATAKTAWTKAIRRGADPDHIVAAVRQHSAFWQNARTEPKFIPYPATWLNAGRYDDELTVHPQQPQQQSYADQGIF